MVSAKRRPTTKCRIGKKKERKTGKSFRRTGIGSSDSSHPPMVGFIVASSLPKTLNLGLLKLVYNLGGRGVYNQEVKIHGNSSV